MKRKSTDRKYGKEFFLFLAIMMLTFGVVLRGQNFSQLKSTLIRSRYMSGRHCSFQYFLLLRKAV